MQRGRAYSLAEAASGYCPPPRVAYVRAHVLPSDPDFLHRGYTVRLLVNGTMTDLFGIGCVAASLDRSVCTVRRLETEGILPPARYRSPGRGRTGQKRLYTREQVLELRAQATHVFAGARRVRSWADEDLRDLFTSDATVSLSAERRT